MSGMMDESEFPVGVRYGDTRFMKTHGMVCERCRYFYDYVCVNADSPYCADFRCTDDCCEWFERREEK